LGSLAEDLTRFAVDGVVDQSLYDRARLSLADTLIAILSARGLPAGVSCAEYMKARPKNGAGSVREFATLTATTESDAAFVNGTLGHGDETDDTMESARMHPGCSIVPTAMAVAEAKGAPFGALLEAITIGYDLGAAVNLSTWNDRRTMRMSVMSPHHVGGLFGSLATILRLRKASIDVGRRAIAYAVQHAGGCMTCLADTEHSEKAVTFGGLPARSALFSYELAELGFTTCIDPFSGSESFYAAFGIKSDPDIARARLREVGRAMSETTIKRYPIGMPIQAACQAIEELIGYGKTASPDSVRVELPTERVGIVDGRNMRDISLQHVLALQLTTGKVDFGALHDKGPVAPAVAELAKRITLSGAKDLDVDVNGFGTTLVARVTWTDKGKTTTKVVAWPLGTPRNPIGWDGMERKAVEVLGACGWQRDAAIEFVRLIRTTEPGIPTPGVVDSITRLASAARH
jgi:2-methylcitrate dehydratase PrpD